MPNQFQISQGQRTAVWKKGDACRVVIDGLIASENVEYEATIKALNEDGSVVVHLIGMGKDVKRMLSELKPTAGNNVRTKQRLKAISSEEQTSNVMV